MFGKVIEKRKTRRSSLIVRFVLYVWIALSACEKQSQGDPNDPNRPQTWYVLLATSLTNGLVGDGGGLGSSTSGWTATLKEMTDYDVRIDPRADLASDAGLDLDNPTTFRTFLQVFYNRESINGDYSADNYSFLFGINNPLPIGNTKGGVTYPRAFFSDFPEYAASFVFKSKIYALSEYLNAEEKWRAVAAVTLHELGHSRGLNAYESPLFEHTFHAGRNNSICLMFSPLERSIAIGEHHFCGKHLKVLHECLLTIKPGYSISPSNSCQVGAYE